VAQHEGLLQAARQRLGSIDVVLVAHGSLPNQEQCQRDFREAERGIAINFTSPLSFVEATARILEGQGSGTIAVISSVAGDRGRQSNYLYGAAKGALSIALAGIRNRLSSKGVHVVTIKPGFVDTPMTAHLPKSALFASPKAVATGIVKAIEKRRDVVYLPWFWCFIMLIIKHIPECIFKRMRL
jgi:short-subunit dehydrogenase